MLPEAILKKLRHAEYWKKHYMQWELNGWDHFYFEKYSSTLKWKSHHALGSELEILVKNLNPETEEGKKVLVLKHQLKKSGKKNNKRESQEKDETTTIRKSSLRKRQKIDYNEERMSKKNCSSAINYVYEEDVDVNICGKSFKEFKEKYDKMEDELKWKLSCTGRVVEDVIYESISNFKSEHLIHSFTIDLDDPIVKGIFFPVELDEIYSTNIKEESELSAEFYENLSKYYEKVAEKCVVNIVIMSQLTWIVQTSVDGVREVMKEADLGDYNFEIDTLKYSVYSLVRQYERNPSAFSLDQYEAWYNTNVWGPIIDRVYDDIPNLNVVRSESSSLASSDRKNRIRTSTTDRKEMGRRGDAIIRKLSGGTRLEFGASESGKHYEGQNGTKWLNESGLKLPKMMRDMFVGLCENANWNMEKMREIETVGYINSGLVLMIMSLDLPAGYITRLTKSEIYNIPEDIGSFSKVIELIAAVWKNATMKILQHNEKDSVNHLKHISSHKKSNCTTNCQTNKILPDNQMTPKKKK